MNKVLGIGNALVDTMVRLESDDFLNEMNLPKGSMQLVDKDHVKNIESKCEGFMKSKSSGGSAANTIHGLARLNVETGFIGKVGNDELGEFFIRDLKSSNIEPIILYGKNHSGHALAFISPDSERTFATHLGAALELNAVDLKDEFFGGYQYLHIEGYLLQNHSLVQRALEMAKKNKLKISLDLASFNVVIENIDVLKKWVNEYVDILFANEEEAKAFTGKEPEDALHEMGNKTEIAVVKTGKCGSLIKKDNFVCRIEPIFANVADTTGAGDAYAAGFLFGLTKDFDLNQCGKIATVLASKVIEGIGAKMNKKQWEEVYGLIGL